MRDSVRRAGSAKIWNQDDEDSQNRRLKESGDPNLMDLADLPPLKGLPKPPKPVTEADQQIWAFVECHKIIAKSQSPDEAKKAFEEYLTTLTLPELKKGQVMQYFEKAQTKAAVEAAAAAKSSE